MHRTLAGYAALIGLLLPVITACATAIPGQPVEATVRVSTATTVATTPSDSPFHPRPWKLPRGATFTVPIDVRPGQPQTVRMKVGDALEIAEAGWLPDNPPEGEHIIDDVMILVEAHQDRLTYQMLSPGSVEVAVGPVGHPGGCDQPGKSCADATPPPMITIVVT